MERLRTLWEQVARLGAHYVYGLPNRAPNNKVVATLVPLGDRLLFENNDIEDDEGWLPLATLSESNDFLVVRSSEPFVVGIWAHDAGFRETWRGFEAFMRALRPVDAPSPFDALKDAAAKAHTMHAENPRDAVVLLTAAIDSFLADDPRPTMSVGARANVDHYLRGAWSLRGFCNDKLDDSAAALYAYEQAAALGDVPGTLNMLAMLVNTFREPDRALARIAPLKEQSWPDGQGCWINIYAMLAHLDRNDGPAAEAEVDEMLRFYRRKHRDLVAKGKAALETYITDERPGAAIARGLLPRFEAGAKPRDPGAGA